MVVIVHRLGHNRTAVGNGELDNNLLSSSPWPVTLPRLAIPNRSQNTETLINCFEAPL